MGQCVAPCNTCYDGLDAMLFRHLPKVFQMKLSQLMSDVEGVWTGVSEMAPTWQKIGGSVVGGKSNL